MKKVFVLAIACVLLLTGCSNGNVAAGAGNEAGTQSASTSKPAASGDTMPSEAAQSFPDASSETAQSVDNPSASSSAALHENVEFDNGGDIIEIKEKMFIAQTNDIYLNAEDYLGKTIKYEGIFDEYHDEISDSTYRYVIRYGPGCCGTDGTAGFEVVWDGGYPAPNDWVEAVGILEEYEEEGGWKYLRLRLSSLDVLDMRGAEYVAQ